MKKSQTQARVIDPPTIPAPEDVHKRIGKHILPPNLLEKMPDPEELILQSEIAPIIKDRLNLFPFDWRD
jgi:hypothetical protein